MSLILHISDLHLVSPDSSPALDDHKAGLVPTSTRFTHYEMLRLTLKRLSESLVERGKKLDAIVVTGDIADKNGESGYQAFLELLDGLASVRPSADRTVVVPGNHDVTTGLSPGDSRRYDRFVRFIRGAGFITPVLNGVDLGTPDRTKHLASFDRIQIIPIDFSAYSQVRLDVGLPDAIWQTLESVVAGSPQQLSALRKLRIADAARVDGNQLEAIRQILADADPEQKSILRIAVLHHHLLPVSAKEEIKPFESLSNLGLVRQFLRDQGISIVLHGHKHTEFSYIDYVSSYGERQENPCQLRVLSGASGSSDFDRADVFRLVDIDLGLSALKVERIGAAAQGTKLTVGTLQTLTFVQPGAAEILATEGCVVITGGSVEGVYKQLVAKLEGQARGIDHVVCRIQNPPKIEEIATLYPGFRALRATVGADDSLVSATTTAEEFRELVTWWQYPVAPITPFDQPATFTHGSRIKRYNGHLDQIESVIESLKGEPDTSRGIIVLLSPEADKISDHDVPFPSFCLIQFQIQGERHDKAPTLSCTAYFRKQEVRYWWLVNLAELAELQQNICVALNQRGNQDLKYIAPGSITTIAARVHAGDSPPKVQIPRVDRYFSLSRERLFAMVNALFWEQMPNRDVYRKEWRRLFAELCPPDKPDKDGTPVAEDGLDYLRREVDRNLQVRKDVPLDWVTALHRGLEQLLAANREFALLQQKEQVTPDNYEKWRATVDRWTKTIIESSEKCIATHNSPTPPK
jgi:3',5'-cyclic AMP phosphodiesterase CpdA